MTTNLTLISTIYSIEPVIVCATRFSPSRIILLTEEKEPLTQTTNKGGYFEKGIGNGFSSSILGGSFYCLSPGLRQGEG